MEFNETRRKLRLCGFDEIKATEITIGIYSRQRLTDIAVSKTPSPAINVTVDTQSTAAERTVSFEEDATPAPAFAAACYDVVAFNETRRKLRICGFDYSKATEITISIYSRPERTDTAETKTPSPVFFEEDASLAAAAPAASAPYSAAVATATEDSSEDGDSPERTDIANIKESFDEEAFCAASAPSSYTKPKVSQSPRFRFFTLHPI